MNDCCFKSPMIAFTGGGDEEFIEVANYAALPVTGETGKIYVTLDNNKLFRWTGSTYVEVSSNTVYTQTVTSAATVTPTNENNLVVITAQAAALTLANPTGTWYQGQALMIRIKDNATPRAITYGGNYRAIGVTLPTTTVASKTTYLGLIYNSTDTKWDIIGVTTQA